MAAGKRSWRLGAHSVLLCLAATLLLLAGCGRQRPTAAGRVERGVAPQTGRVERGVTPQTGNDPLVLEAACRPTQDGLEVEVTVTNVGPRTVHLRRRLVPPQILHFAFVDAAGREVKYEGSMAQLQALWSKDEFVPLQPGEMHGVRVKLVRGAGAPPGPYQIMLLPNEPGWGSYVFHGPGLYSLVVSYAESDDGHRADDHLGELRGWTGSLQSERIWFELPPAQSPAK
jgi:hypothetical protein